MRKIKWVKLLAHLLYLTIQLKSCILVLGEIERRGMFLHTYKSSSGRDLILEYIDSLTEPERVDAFSILECMENGEFDKIVFKQWNVRFMRFISESTTEYFMLRQMSRIYICYMLAVSRKIKQKRQIRSL